ncbi:MAG: hypothetical protein JJE22_20125 [Bacteroidia bacterium]|nr:hypothetical protein [Bacteroidia bacterium]
MKFLKAFSIVLFFFAVIISCKHKKVSLSGNDPVEIGDFIDFFQPTSLPFSFTDIFLQQKDKDSLLISYKVFTQFVPDSMLNKVFGKNTKLKIYPMGSSKVAEGENYLFVKVVAFNKRAAFIVCFDKKNEFIAGMPLLLPDRYASTTQTVTIDKKYTIFKTLLRKNADGSLSEGKNVYILNAEAKNFMLILTDALDDKITEIINPIDTLTRKNKLSADYSGGKMNLVSIRDGRKNDRLTFFIHFEKNNGACNGELKGEAMLKGSNIAEYRENGESCVLRFLFSPTSVSLKEIEGCGAHRGLRCLFDGRYTRKKEILPKKNIIKPANKK